MPVLCACLLLLTVAAEPEPTRVKVGVFLRNAEAINLEQNAYNLSFTLWFKWKGAPDAVKGLKLVNVLDAWGLTQQPIYEELQTLPDGSHYQRFLVEGRFFNKFRLHSYPLDRQQLVLELEELRSEGLVLEADEASAVRDGLMLPGWKVGHSFQDARLIPSVTGQGEGVRLARYRFGIDIERPWSLFILTLAPPLLLVLLCCWLVFFLRAQHVDARIGTVITALLTIVFLDLAYTDDVPYLSGVVLLDQLFNLAYVVMTAMLLCCVLVVRWKDRATDLRTSAEGDEAARIERGKQAELLEGKIVRLDGWALKVFPPVYLLGCTLLILLRD